MAWKKGKRFSEEHRKKISEGNIGRNRSGFWNSREHPRGMLGKTHSEESRKRISESMKIVAKRRDFNYYERIGFTRKGSTASEESRNLMRTARIRYFQDHPEARKELRELRFKQVLPRKDTSIEIKVQEALTLMGIEFEKHKEILGITQCDIFLEPNICIFVDGCYFHSCQECFPDRTKLGTIQNKNLIRDALVNESFSRSGKYEILRIWEHEINGDIGKVMQRIMGAIKNEIKR